ncbi:imidazoleglycerol-phosphate dehydratase [Neisseria flavescens]|nr:imidazoleglycerol-phosphate dehydratase [Neisseria flavescens]
MDTGVPFLEHMLAQVARHGLIDLDITCNFLLDFRWGEQ